MAPESHLSPAAAAQGSHRTPRRRRPPSLAEQERRKAWGKKWGQAGKALNRRIRESG